MKNRQTIFKKYLCISMLVILLGFSVLGIMIVYFVTQNWETERWESMRSNATTISLAITENARIENENIFFDESDYEMLTLTMETLSNGIKSDIFVTNNIGKVLFCSENSIGIEAGVSVDSDMVNRAMNAGIGEVTTLGGLYSSDFYVVGVPVQILTDGELSTMGAVFVTSNASYYREYMQTLVKIFCSAGIVTFALVFCFVGLFSYQLTRPLQQMSKAAKAFGKGDFTTRVRVTGNDEIGELAKAFNNMADSLASSEGMRRSFVANVSHELKTPMTTIAGFIDGILDGTIPKEKENYYLNIVTVEIKRLSRLVTSMLALSRIDSGELKMVKQTFDISSTVLNTFLTFEQKIDERKINVTGFDDSEPLFLDGDPDMIHQVVYNLVENAVKFTNVGGYINVSVVDEGTRAVISITNSGAGIPPEQIGFIFDRFYKTDKSRSHDKNGMGLGLYIVKTIVQLHGGEITAESIEGEYTRFRFWLPKKKDSAIKKRAAVKESREEKSVSKSAKNGEDKHEAADVASEQILDYTDSSQEVSE